MAIVLDAGLHDKKTEAQPDEFANRTRHRLQLSHISVLTLPGGIEKVREVFCVRAAT